MSCLNEKSLYITVICIDAKVIVVTYISCMIKATSATKNACRYNHKVKKSNVS